ncbi:hypothetical protein ACJIZ3_023177 [Penstemon smallii]|uniref:non-specific serine/threonine protein kinase n=1 Tax=Penstemon smallii TaxID=265156 RepID=A0ABD3TPM6_9LAMI
MGLLSLSFFVLWMLEIVSAQPTTSPLEVDAINKIIDHWSLRSKLNVTVDPCIENATWAPESANPRIACDCSETECHITHLKIYALDISGELPRELFLLTELMDLNLGQNMLNGSIPPAIGQLSKMEYLSISSNNFQGTLPHQLGNLTSLQQLYMDSSGVSGPIPDDISNLKSLQTLWASDNRFTGKIPEFLGTFSDIKVLRLEGTNLEGPIPSSFGSLTKLEDLRIGDLGGNDSSLGFLDNLTSLSILSLRNCRIGGQIPEQLSALPNLKILDLSFNKLTGRVPASFKNFSSLKYLYLGSNNLNGDLTSDFISSQLIALNVVGTSINDVNLNNEKASGMLHCLQGNSKCSNKLSTNLFSVNCGGKEQVSADGVKFDDDSEMLGAASLYRSSNNQWAVSSSGVFISNPNGPRYIAQTDSQITNTLDSELYKTARISPNSLRYYGLGLEDGVYRIELHFAEIQMDVSPSWKGLGRRLFDVYIQGVRVLQDFNILSEAGGSKRALIKTFEANVTNTVMDIHLVWAGKGTCCIPVQSTYGPLVSAIHVSQVSELNGSSKSDRMRVGRILGICIGGFAGLLIICSVFYLWWIKKEPGHMKIHTKSDA